VGDLTRANPKLRQGSFFPVWREPRRRLDKALYAVVMEAYTGDISTRKVESLVEALGGASGISKSEVSRICQGLDEQVKAFLGRPLDHVRFPYVYLDAIYLHGRLGRNLQVVSRAVVVAIGINALSYREVLGIAVGDSEEGLLAAVPREPQRAGAGSHPAVDIRRPPGSDNGDQADVPRLLVATLPGALPAQPALASL
jgi:transposase-like protein